MPQPNGDEQQPESPDRKKRKPIPMTRPSERDAAVSVEMLGKLPLQYVDGPDYCTVTDATGGAFALTVQPELMKLMEKAARRSPVPATENMQDAPCCRYQRVADLQRRHSGMATQKYSTN